MTPPSKPNRRRRILVLTRFSPLEGSSGAGTYLFSLLRYLRENGFKITVCWSERPPDATRQGHYRVPREFARVARLVFPESLALGNLRLFPKIWGLPFKARWLDRVKRLLFALGLGPVFRKLRPQAAPSARPTPNSGASQPGAAPSAVPLVYPAWDRPLEPAERRFFLRAIARFHPSTLLFNFCWMTPLAESLEPPEAYQKITLTHDLRHLYSTLVNGEIRHTEGEWTRKEDEQRMLQATDTIAAIREDDAQVFARLLPGKKVITVPPSFSVTAAQPSPAEPLPHRCLFAGSDAEANREGIAWFVENAWPLVRAAVPGAELHLCGPVCHVFKPQAPGVTPLGFVESLEAEYAQAAAVIVPLLRGSGVKIKLMEALAHGKACVTTPIGIEGLPLLAPAVLCQSSPETFAASLALLLTQPKARRELETTARALIRKHFSPTACYGPLREHIIAP